jgi:hypothetical protein
VQTEFAVCPFVDKETDGSYPFANALNGLAHLWKLGQSGHEIEANRTVRRGTGLGNRDKQDRK